MSEPVRYEQDGGIVTLTLNEPRTRNAISPAIVEAMVECIDRINADLSVGCVILTGAGEGFSSGGNVKVMKERTGLFGGSPAEIRRGYLQGIQRIPLAMYGLEAPAIAAVNGAAVGAGCDLASMCDMRIAGRSATFAESFLRVGLVSKVVDDDKLMEEARTLARRIAAQPVHSLRLTKRLLRDSQQVSLPIALEMASSMQALAQHTRDQHEAVLAFTEKRKPKFEGR
jgi:enoyl-CoA hydratase/carnithine racemase